MRNGVDHEARPNLSPRTISAIQPARTRRRLSRTLSAGRWKEYERLLSSAFEHGYEPLSLESWLIDPTMAAGRKVLLMRHDVDQHPGSALRMADIERDLGITSTWYFRWRTAHGPLIAELRRRGHAVGLHYETLSRQARSRAVVPDTEVPRLVPGARHVLRGEILAFESRYGPIRSVCPHGDSRVPGVRNAELLRGEDWATYGIEFDAHLAMRRSGLGFWLTDRSRAEGGWKDGTDPEQLFSDAITPILTLVHPNNWVSGPSLWRDRLTAAVLSTPVHDPGHAPRTMRTGDDTPPV